MHTVFALLCFVVVIHWLIFPYPSGLLHWHCGNLTIAPVPAKQPWWIWINTSCEFIMNDCITTTKQSTTKLCAYFLGYTVYWASSHLYDVIFFYFIYSCRQSADMLFKPNTKTCFSYRLHDCQCFCFGTHWPDGIDIIQNGPLDLATFKAHFSVNTNTTFPLNGYQEVDTGVFIMKWHICFQSRNSKALPSNTQNIIYRGTVITNTEINILLKWFIDLMIHWQQHHFCWSI